MFKSPLYRFAIHLLRFIFWVFNGKPKVTGLENIPKNQAVILASTHHSNTDPVFLKLITDPLPLYFMAKDTLFNNPIFSKAITFAGAFPVNRKKPSRETIKYSVDLLTKHDSSLCIFPTGSRHSSKVKSGTAFIQSLSKVDIIPISINPPVGFWQFISRKKCKIAIGTAIKYEQGVKYNREKLKEIDELLQQSLDELDTKAQAL